MRKEEKQKAQEKRKDISLDAEFQGRARRDKKTFLSEQSKEVEENNRMGKTRDLFKKIRDNFQGKFSCKDKHNKGQKYYGPNRSRRD